MNGKLVEIKGKQFIDNKGKWINPFNSKYNKECEYKHKILIKNDVEIITDIKLYSDFVNKYFKTKKNRRKNI